jgi:hypothetical protein
MNILRRFGLSLAVLLFSACISTSALFVSLYFVINTPQPLKQALTSSGMYDVLVPSALAEQESGASSSVPLNDPGVRRALEQALPPTFVKNSFEQVIDGTYDWVHGISATPHFSIELAPVKATFADNIAAYVQQKLGALPACPYIVTPPSSTEDVLSLTCMPQGISVASVAEMARREALHSKFLSENSRIDATTLKNNQGTPLTDQLAIVPRLHSYYILSLYLLPVVILLCTAAILYWSQTKRAGIKRIAWLFISVGLATMVLAAVEVWILHAGIAVFGMPASATATIQEKLLAALEMLLIDLRSWWFGFGAGYTLLGIIVLIILRFNRPKQALTMGDQRHAKQPEPLAVDVPPAPETTNHKDRL